MNLKLMRAVVAAAALAASTAAAANAAPTHPMRGPAPAPKAVTTRFMTVSQRMPRNVALYHANPGTNRIHRGR